MTTKKIWTCWGGELDEFERAAVENRDPYVRGISGATLSSGVPLFGRDGGLGDALGFMRLYSE